MEIGDLYTVNQTGEGQRHQRMEDNPQDWSRIFLCWSG